MCEVFQLFNFIFLQSTFGNGLVTEIEKGYAVNHIIKKTIFRNLTAELKSDRFHNATIYLDWQSIKRLVFCYNLQLMNVILSFPNAASNAAAFGSAERTLLLFT